MLSHRQLSELIGMIYDCAIDPDRWPPTLAAICQSIGCGSGFILLVDLEQSHHKFAYSWGLSPDWKERYFAYSDQLTGFYSLAFSRQYGPDGEPLIMSRFIDLTGLNGKRIYEDLRRTLSITDVMQTVVLREARRIAILTASRHQNDGTLIDQDAATMRLLAPHVRRAVKIIDILDANKIEADTLEATLDTFIAGVLIVGERGRILHANDAARRMLSAREPIVAIDGTLSARNAAANEELSAAIRLARDNEAQIGSSGLGVPLRCDEPSVAHVLPLARGNVRTRLMPQATAAVFITRAERESSADIRALVRIFDLTAAEIPLLEQLTRNATLADAAKTLRISQETARTHLAHIFSKTGVSRQADLLTLVDRLAPPIRRSAS
ncbi:helix-turn-helix transcriptional regulator [Bradyrhizobium sp.]|uniref:helix-turn-helix transcriptional regulator n=1 Tax=Bradyrhizobium sp. TaxID=376 RepID=UPI003BB0834B